MKILSMTATFGKLEHEELKLEPGLNLIDAPNEWGKTTWCTFLMTMFYGLETRERSTKTTLADKEHYAPWSGSPMSGRMDLQWKGRHITIERRSKGRTPMGQFRAYETDSGLPVEELTATNCGQLLLGVERSVFARTGFLRSTEMPVSMNEELRSRLNALVTTGDDSGTAEELGQKLRDLKNRCRYNRSGLIPQAQERQRQLESQLREYEALERQTEQLQQRQQQLQQESEIAQKNAVRDHQLKMEQAIRANEEAQRRCSALEEQCAQLPDRATAETPPPVKKSRRGLWLGLAGLCLLTGIVVVLLGSLWGLMALIPAIILLIVGVRIKPEPLVCWNEVLEAWASLEEARQEVGVTQERIRSLQMEGEPQIRTYQQQIQQMHLQLGQCQGRMSAIGDPGQLRLELEQVEHRLRRLEQTEQALELAQQTLAQARAQLQRRFAPGIAQRAQTLLSRLTGGRYDRLTLGQELSVLAGAEGEDTLRGPLWRSEGTADQLYLALRLAVAEELMPGMPLILDDALIRFDQTRLTEALRVLQEQAQNRQVIVFSCRPLSGGVQSENI